MRIRNYVLIMGVLGIFLFSFLVMGRTNTQTYGLPDALNVAIPVQYVQAFDLTTPNNTITLPLARNDTWATSEPIRIDGMDIVRVEDWSSSPNMSTVNVVMNCYADTVYKKTKAIPGSATMDFNVTEERLIATVNIPLNQNYIITGNRFSLIDFSVSKKNLAATANVTLNITVRKSANAFADTITNDVVVLPAGTATTLNYTAYRAIKVCNYQSNPVYVGASSVTSLNYGVNLNSSDGRCLTMGDVSALFYAYSSSASTLNVLLLK